MTASFRFAGSPARWAGVVLFVLGGVFAGAACNSDDTTPAADSGAGGGGESDTACLTNSGPVPATGPDTHCVDDDGGMIVQVADICPSGGADAANTEPLPGPRGGNESDDDDCKYHVKFTNTCVSATAPVTFTVTVTNRTDERPVTGASTRIEGLLNDNHPIGNPPPVTTEMGGGVYRITGVVFNASGTWLIRFHFFETCDDTVEDSKHGHAAFSILVP